MSLYFTIGTTVQKLNLCIWMMTFHLSHCEPDTSFQPIAKLHVLYVYIIQLFVWAVLLKSRAVGICPSYRHEKEKHWEQYHVEMGFSYLKKSVTALFHRFIFVWTNCCSIPMNSWDNHTLSYLNPEPSRQGSRVRPSKADPDILLGQVVWSGCKFVEMRKIGQTGNSTYEQCRRSCLEHAEGQE